MHGKSSWRVGRFISGELISPDRLPSTDPDLGGIPMKKPAARCCPASRTGIQCPDAPAAPSPVSDRTCCASKSTFSLAACELRSSTEKIQMPRKPMVIENRAGEVYGNKAEPFGLPSTAPTPTATPP